MNKGSLAIIIIIIVLLAVAGILWYYTTYNTINREGGSEENTSKYTIVDVLNNTITLNSTPKRIVSLAPSITETLFSLELESYIVGVDSSSYNTSDLGIHSYCIEHSIKDVGGYWWSEINVEKILSLNPDLVLADAGAHVKLEETFNSYGLKVVYLHGGSASSLNDVYEDIDVIAGIFHVEDGAQDLKEGISGSIAEARHYIVEHGLNGSKVVIVVGFYDGIWVAGRSTYIDDIIDRIELVNPVDKEGWSLVNLEDLIRYGPDAVIINTLTTNDTVAGSGITSVCSRIIYLNQTEVNILSRPGPRLGAAAKIIAYRLGEVFGAGT